MKLTPPIRVAVVGTGLMGEVHARNVYARGATARLVAVADVDVERARALASEFGGARVDEGVEVVAADDVDAVIIASPDATHAGYALACIRSGKPVLCEKPLASTADDAWAVVEAEAATGQRLVQVGFMREFDPAHVAVRFAVTSGRIGNPVMFRGTHLNPAPGDLDSVERCITQSMIHDFHSARFLTGREIVEVYARWVPLLAGDPTSVRVATVTCTFDDGAVGLIDVNAAAEFGYEVSAEVTGVLGTASTVSPSRAAVRVAGQCETDVTMSWQTRFAHAYELELDAWLASLVTGVPVGPGTWDGYAANAVADAACRSVVTGAPEQVHLRPRPE